MGGGIKLLEQVIIFYDFIRVFNYSVIISYFYSLLKKIEIWTKYSGRRSKITSEKNRNSDNGWGYDSIFDHRDDSCDDRKV